VGLQARYKSLTVAPALQTPTPAPTQPDAGAIAPARRDLSALRQRLAGGSNGGGNPPEASAALKAETFEPCTTELPSGETVALPNHPDAAKASQAASTVSAPTPGPEGEQPAKRKRRPKAEMEAARAAESASSSASSGPATAAPEALAADPPEFHQELAAAVAETSGFTVLTDDLRTLIESEAVTYYLRNLSLEGAITLVRERLPAGVKTLEVEK